MVGLFGAAVFFFLYTLFLVGAANIIRRQTEALSRFVGLGVAATLGTQAVINLMVVTGLAPTKGIALPLLSSGGTGWMLTAACLGLLIGMDRRAVAAEAPVTRPSTSTDASQALSVAAPGSLAV